jgi:YHS domain-containing protein
MRTFVLIVLLACAACKQVPPPKSANAPAPSQTEMRTIDSVPPQPVVLEPPPVLPDEAPAPKPRDAVQAENMTPLTEQDEQVRAKLPFAPAIGLDPVDGAKISIRATTPSVETKSRVFYFSSEENKRTFLANPAQFMKGVFH